MTDAAGLFVMLGLMFIGCEVSQGLDNVATHLPKTCVEAQH